MPPRYRHVLVAFDGSPEAELALAHAVAIAQAYRARLALVAVVAAAAAALLAGAGRDARRLRGRAGGAASRGCARPPTRCPTTCSVTTRLLDGDPARELVRAARDGEHDLIVMGSRGRGRVTAAVLGSVSNHVMHEAGVPVIVIHRAGRRAPTSAA